ncbi:MAG: GNAT family N-acetyltransferase [Solirubrobacteraceae bacterium]
MESSPGHSRIAGTADAEEVAALLDRFQLEFDSFTPGAAALVQRVRRHITQHLSVFLLAAPAEVGVAQLRFREYMITGETVCTLEELYVVPERRGEGHGRTLVQSAFSVAREQGATVIELTTAENDAAARGLYRSLGFTNLEKPGRPETRMLYYERELSPKSPASART